MFLHAGNSKNIRIRDIVGIFDMDNSTVSSVTRKFLSENQKNGRVFSVSEEIPKSYIVFRNGETYNICFSPLSSSALTGRISL